MITEDQRDVVVTSVKMNNCDNSSFKDQSHEDEHTRRTFFSDRRLDQLKFP